MLTNTKTVVIVEGLRTPFVPAGGKFENMPAEELSAYLLRELLQRTQIPVNEVGEFILSNTLNSIHTPQIAQTVGARAGLVAPCVFTSTENKTNALEIVFSAVEKARTNGAGAVIAGGVENMSQAPILLAPGLTKIIKKITQAKTRKDKLKQALSLKMGDIKLLRAGGWGGATGAGFSKLSREWKAEMLSKKFHILREEQDAFTLMSFQKADRAGQEGRWREEVVPVFPPVDFELVDKDLHLENAPSARDLSAYLTLWDKDCGSVTRGNSAPPADGSALLLLMNREKAQALGYNPLAEIYHFARVSVPPHQQGWETALVVEKLLKQAKLLATDIDLFEIDEDFAVQTPACLKALGMGLTAGPGLSDEGRGTVQSPVNPAVNQAVDQAVNPAVNQTVDPTINLTVDPEKCNVNGGALALGNPLSAGPFRMVLTLTKEMNKRHAKWGVVAHNGDGAGSACALLLKNTKK